MQYNDDDQNQGLGQTRAQRNTRRRKESRLVELESELKKIGRKLMGWELEERQLRKRIERLKLELDRIGKEKEKLNKQKFELEEEIRQTKKQIQKIISDERSQT